MKKIVLMAFLASFMMWGCKKDDDDDSSSGSGSDPCDGVECVNGECINGDCECDLYYTGEDCSEFILPDNAYIEKIIVTAFPPYDGGGSWDLTSDGDIYPLVTTASENLLWESPTFVQNALPSQGTFEFVPSSPILLSNISSTYCVSLYDYDDFDADDFMGGICFTPVSTNANGVNYLIDLEAFGTDVEFTLWMNYSW